MMYYWQRLALRIDALTLRERAIIFAMTALILITLINAAFLDRQFAEQKKLSQRLKEDQASLTMMQAQMQEKSVSRQSDPDRANKERLQQLDSEIDRIHLSLRDMQKGLVSPDRMSALLEDVFKQNSNLRLISLKTVPPTSLLEETGTEEKLMKSTVATDKGKTGRKTAGGGEGAGAAVYKHGVEIVVQGRYLDIMTYLAQLEEMPWHLFWHQAVLEVDYPKATLTLTLFTLSLDEKWLNL